METKKLKKKYGSNLAWNEEDYIKYKDQVKSARIEAIRGLISDFNNWSILSKEEGNQLDKIIENLKDYLNLLYKINEELKNYLEYLEE